MRIFRIVSIVIIYIVLSFSQIRAQIQFVPHTISDSANTARSVYAIDMDGDTDIDVLSANYWTNDITWYENDGNQNFTYHFIDYTLGGSQSVFAIDVDGDMDIDVLSASSIFGTLQGYDISWYENDGNQNFGKHYILFFSQYGVGEPISAYAIDLDGDGDIDVLAAALEGNNVSWFENDGNQNFTFHSISTNAPFANSVYGIDLDGDTDIDVLAASGLWRSATGKIAWYENDGSQNFTEHIITDSLNKASSAYAIDLDNDSDIDVLSAGAGGDKIAWYENDGNQVFDEHIITSNADGARSVYAADLDGDTHIDVLSASYEDDKIAWYRNDGSQNFTEHTINDNADGAYSVYAIDLDSDGDMDVLSASELDDKIVWYENSVPVSISEQDPSDVPDQFRLRNNYPNPFNPETNIEFDVARNSHIELKVYDIQGHEVATLVNERLPAGHYTKIFNGNELASGIYFYQIRMGDFHEVKKMALIQ